MKKLMLVVAVVILSGCTASKNTSDLKPGMTRNEVVNVLGKPTSSTMLKGNSSLVYKVHDQAYGREYTLYSMGFENDRLTSITPLSDDMQEMGLLDRAVRSIQKLIDRPVDNGNTN